MSAPGVLVRIFNEAQDLVFERVTRFSYVHSEKVDDNSSIVIETDLVNIVDDPDLQEDKAIILVWGFTGGVTQKRKVYIWDIIPTFNETGVRLEIKAYCLKAYTKLNSSKDVWNGTNLKGTIDELAESYGLSVQDGVNGVVDESETFEEGESATQFGLARQGEMDFEASKFNVERDSTRNVQYKYKEYEALPQSAKSDAKFMDDTVAIEPIDNLVLEGRDDNLIIKRRNLKQLPYKSYQYKGEPGILLEFIPASKNYQMKKNTISSSVSGWIEDEKKYIQGGIGAGQLGNGVLGDTVEMSLEQQAVEEVIASEDNPFDRPVTFDGLSVERIVKDDDGNPISKIMETEKLDTDDRKFIYWSKQGTQTSKVVLGKRPHITAALDATGRIHTKGFRVYSKKETIPTVETNPKDIAGIGVNRKSGNDLELKDSSAKIIGDPSLVSGKIITILGAGNKYSGNYYVYHVEHTITPEGGYICNVKMYKNGNNLLDAENPNEVNVDRLGNYKNKVVTLPADGTSELKSIPITDDQ